MSFFYNKRFQNKLFNGRTINIAQSGQSPDYALFWSMESDSIDYGSVTSGPNYSFGAVRTGSYAYQGASSLYCDKTQGFSQVIIFNDTDTDLWGANTTRGKLDLAFMWSGLFSNGAMVCQIDGKSNLTGLDTNDGLSIKTRLVGGANDKAFRISVGYNDSIDSFFFNATGLNMVSGVWYNLSLQWDKNGLIDGSKTVKFLVDGSEKGSSTSTFNSFSCNAWHHMSIGNDTSATGMDIYLDNLKLYSSY